MSITENVARVRAEIEAAAIAAGRDPKSIQLCAATKMNDAEAVREAIRARAEHGVFGYSIVPEEWYQAYISWWRNRHDFTMEQDWLIFCTGVVPAISSMVRKLTTPAEKVLLMTPVYNIFFNSILNN